eukprot:TRINITY_DN9281_c0_g1_i2.p1 TRINITY_DN9281_c0_g1~~TRINITY_DN9281_c0_g1_i2.p1  ORF type:complete len:104 (+),score=7.23 TRINITY_DN9281_c0_g1_i2:414-725(+)
MLCIGASTRIFRSLMFVWKIGDNSAADQRKAASLYGSFATSSLSRIDSSMRVSEVCYVLKPSMRTRRDSQVSPPDLYTYRDGQFGCLFSFRQADDIIQTDVRG